MAKKKQLPDHPEEFPQPSEVPEIQPDTPERLVPDEPAEEPGSIPDEEPVPEESPTEIPPLPAKEH